MAGDLTMRVELRDGVYVLRREECVRVAAALEAAQALGPVAAALRDDLRRALDGVERVPAPNPFEGEDGTDAADAPKCFFCGEPGVALGDDLWECRTRLCVRKSRPAARGYFETGQR